MSAGILDLSRVAQTNVALYRQLHDLGYGPAALRLVRDAYELAAVPFAGHYRACGKPFVCHLVGTASVMASIGAKPELVAAAILHSVYEPFFAVGNNQGAARLSPARIRSAVGEEVERYVAAYAEMKWSLATMPALAVEARAVEGDRADVFLLKLANEVDDHLELTMAYCSDQRRRIDSTFDLWVEMADSLRSPLLAGALREIKREQAEGGWALALGGGHATSYSAITTRPGSFDALRRWAHKLNIG